MYELWQVICDEFDCYGGDGSYKNDVSVKGESDLFVFIYTTLLVHFKKRLLKVSL